MKKTKHITIDSNKKTGIEIKFYYDQLKNDESKIKANISDYLHILLISKKIFKHNEVLEPIYIDRRWSSEKKLIVLITQYKLIKNELERLKKK